MGILGYLIAIAVVLVMALCSLVVFVDIKDLNKRAQNQDSEDTQNNS